MSAEAALKTIQLNYEEHRVNKQTKHRTETKWYGFVVMVVVIVTIDAK